VTFIIQSLPSYTPPEAFIYIAGNFNGWNPGDVNYRLSKNAEEMWFITLGQGNQGSSIQYKFTLGNWETVEKGPNGEEIDNRNFVYGNGDTVDIFIANWRQDGGGTSTAAENVSILSEDFEMPQLGRTRRIWLYLPPDYDTSVKSYPVLYMHDGQNLFDAATSFAGEWEVDETLNGFFGQGYQVPIVVGIDHGDEYRIPEYTPWPHPSYGGGEGDLYLQFIIETLKPYIDQNYRTLSGREYTAVMGSSLGGLISHYAALKYPEVFGLAGIFSPSFWWSALVWPFAAASETPEPMRLYMMCGSGEGQGTINNVLNMQDSLLAHGIGTDELNTLVIPGGQHNESFWRQEFGDAYRWLFGSFMFSVNENPGPQKVLLFPNPVDKILQFPSDFPQDIDFIDVIDMNGKTVMHILSMPGRAIDVSSLIPGFYLVYSTAGTESFLGRFIRN
jgi:predicted alpha/beta superfamily hydrolase